MKTAPGKSVFSPESGIEVIDVAGKPFLVMPQEQVLRQRLRHRAVLACLRNTKGRIFLYKKNIAAAAEGSNDIWLPALHGRVMAGESRYDAASRLLETQLGITGLELFEVARFTQPASGPAVNLIENIETTLFLTAKTSAIPRLREHEGQEGMFVDEEELRAILRDYPHMLPPLWNPALPYFFPK